MRGPRVRVGEVVDLYPMYMYKYHLSKGSDSFLHECARKNQAKITPAYDSAADASAKPGEGAGKTAATKAQGGRRGGRARGREGRGGRDDGDGRHVERVEDP